MAKKNKNKRKQNDDDGPYFLKLVLLIIIGSQWIWLIGKDGNVFLPVPAGFLVGLLLVRNEHFKIDRKIEYAVLLVAALISFWSQVGIYINL